MFFDNQTIVFVSSNINVCLNYFNDLISLDSTNFNKSNEIISLYKHCLELNRLNQILYTFDGFQSI